MATHIFPTTESINEASITLSSIQMKVNQLYAVAKDALNELDDSLNFETVRDAYKNIRLDINELSGWLEEMLTVVTAFNNRGLNAATESTIRERIAFLEGLLAKKEIK